jgi:hypothetical protein
MDPEVIVTGGVDTHTDVHMAAVLDQTGRLLATQAFPATTRGYARLATWLESFGPVDKIGMEGTGHFGAGLLRFLRDYGLTVIEVDRPDRSSRRRNGKSDPLDAESAARAVQSGRANGTPKSRDAEVEMIRALRVARRGAMKARVQAGDQLESLVVSAPTWPPTTPLCAARSPCRRPSCWSCVESGRSWPRSCCTLGHTPAASIPKPPSPPSEASRHCRHRRATPTATGSTAAVTDA